MFFKMTLLVLKSLFKKPATRLYPFVKREPFDATRGRIGIDVMACIFCGLCQRKCPADAILVNRDQKEWTIERLRCIACGYCVEVCPKKCLNMEKKYTDPTINREQETHTQNA